LSRADARNSVEYIRTSTCGILSSYRQNVVKVGAGRTSRSARIATSSELLYLLKLLYNMPIECCGEYKLIQLYQKSSVWCFAFSHASTFELISSVASARPGVLVTIGGEYGHVFSVATLRTVLVAAPRDRLLLQIACSVRVD